jgi:type III restriction enzyme
MTTRRLVDETPGIGGGFPQVRGTRIPVWVIVNYYRDLGSVEQVQELFPYLDRAQIQDALNYYAACPARVDEDRERNARTLAELQGHTWPD